HFDPAASSRSAAKFDPAELQALSRSLVHAMPFAQAAQRLQKLGISGPLAEPFWKAVRGNVDRVEDAAFWWRVVTEGPERTGLPGEDRAFVCTALDLLPPEPWDEE